MNMDELVKDLEFAYRMISNIPVSGDAVDMMASARAKLRKVFVELKAKEQKEGDSNGE
jgi:hypothetical protein